MKSILLILASFLSLTLAAIEEHKVDKLSLPGWPTSFNYSVYSGLLQISQYKQLHYVFVES